MSAPPALDFETGGDHRVTLRPTRQREGAEAVELDAERTALLGALMRNLSEIPGMEPAWPAIRQAILRSFWESRSTAATPSAG